MPVLNDKSITSNVILQTGLPLPTLINIEHLFSLSGEDEGQEYGYEDKP